MVKTLTDRAFPGLLMTTPWTFKHNYIEKGKQIAEFPFYEKEYYPPPFDSFSYKSEFSDPITFLLGQLAYR